MPDILITVVSGETTNLALAVPGTQGPIGLGFPSGGTTNQVLFKQSNTNYDATWGNVTSAMISDLSIVNADISASAAIVDTKLATIATVNKVSNSATTAASANTASAIVARDASGNFTAGTITAALTGAASSNVLKAGDTMTGVLAVTAGTAALPGLAIASDLNTGIYSPGANQLAISTNGTGRLFVASDGRVLHNHSGAVDTNPFSSSHVPRLVTTSTETSNYQGLGSIAYNGSFAGLWLARSAGTTVDAFNALTSGNDIGAISFAGADGATFINAARIRCIVDGAVSTNTVPGALLFATSASGSSPTERVRVASNGNVGIGTSSPATTLDVNGDVTITDKIIHTGDTNTAIRFPAADTIALETNGSERARIDSSGRLLVGTSTGLADASTVARSLQVIGTTAATAGQFNARFSNDANSSTLVLGKSRGTVGVYTVVNSGDQIGRIEFDGADGTKFVNAARITAEVDGTPGTDDMPGRLLFSTTADGSAAPTERMRIRSDGNIGIGGNGSGNVSLYNQGPITGSTTAYSNFSALTIQSDVTTTAFAYRTQLTTAAAAFTLANAYHYAARQIALGADSAITNQFGFGAESSLTGATNNYGFHGSLASATGRWNFYAAGTAPNYFAGDVRTNTAFTTRTAPADSNTSTTATASSLLDGLRTGTPTGNIDLTLPTGTDMDSAFQELQTNQSFEWSVINLAAATHVITVVAASGHTVVGNMAVAANSSGRFITRKTAANTFISYRIA